MILSNGNFIGDKILGLK